MDMLKFPPVCLPKKNDIFEDKNGWVYGELNTNFTTLNKIILDL